MIESSGITRSINIAGRRGVELNIPGFTVTVTSGTNSGLKAVASGGPIKVGTDDTCHLVLTDLTVSRRHAVLDLGPTGVTITDLGSKNGTWIGESRVQQASVADGGSVRVGETLLLVNYSTRQLVALAAEETSYCGMLSSSPSMREIFAVVKQMASFDLPISIIGESGTGKELIARALHEAGPRRDKPFLILDCASVVKELLSSSLFGHEKGAFTGADRLRHGIFEEARGGTVFLDEVGELDLSVQPNLLRVLENHEIQRLGSSESLRVDFRVVSATHRDLRAWSLNGKFRQDLYYRMSAVVIHVPPLRDRLEDLPMLVQHHMDVFAQRNRLTTPVIDPAALGLLMDHSWPGNIRELRNVVETLCATATENVIQSAHVLRALAAAKGPGPDKGVAGGPGSPDRSLDATEKKAILTALVETGWNRKQAAVRLGISRTTLYEKIRHYGLVPPWKTQPPV